jgi:ribosomal protein L11 methylase PrmA
MEDLFLNKGVVKAILSSPLQTQYQKISLRATSVKEQSIYQLSIQKGQQVFHANYSSEQVFEIVKKYIPLFKQLHLYTQDELYHYLWNRQRKETLIRKKISTPLLCSSAHNKDKNYLISDKKVTPFLLELGIQTKTGAIKSDKRDKFLQINKFLEILIPALKECKTIVDFGCGKAYLTFALAHIFKGRIVGVDLKESLLDSLNTLAKKLNYNHLSFEKGSIQDYTTSDPIDAIIALHACNIATDEALYQGIKRGAKVMIVAPCCHQELYPQVASDMLTPLLKHGILKEKFASLVTDAARAELLAMHGYKTDVMEFIDHGHTPKNILIRAIKTAKAIPPTDYVKFCNLLHIQPHLQKLLKIE